MLTTNNWSNEIFNQCQTQDGCFFIPFSVGKWLFVGCIIFSFLLLAYEARKSKKIIASRDISYAFTNIMANHYYSLSEWLNFFWVIFKTHDLLQGRTTTFASSIISATQQRRRMNLPSSFFSHSRVGNVCSWPMVLVKLSTPSHCTVSSWLRRTTVHGTTSPSISGPTLCPRLL